VNVEHNANGLHWAMDNRIYTAEHDSYFRLKNGGFTVEKTIYRGQWGLSHDDAGRIYRNVNGSPIFVDLIAAPYFVRNPNLLRSRGAYEGIGNADVGATYPVRPTPGIQGGFQANALRPDGTLPRYTGAGTPTVFRGDRLPRELYGNVFVTEPVGNLVSRILVSDDGSTLRASRAYAKAEFLTSTDERFRPVNLASGPDGTLYVVDMYRGIIQHRDYISQYLKDHIDKYGLEQPTDRGRIYRVVHDSMRPGPRPALSAATPAQLVRALSHPNGWWRDTAQRLLVERANKAAVPALVTAAQTSPDWRTRLHALWTLDGMDAIEAGVVTHALTDESRDVRIAAVRLSERWLGDPTHPIRAEVLKKIDDPDWNVRQQFAATLGELDRASRVNALATMIERHGDDPVVMDAAISGASGLEPQVLGRLLDNRAETPERSAGITMLAATIVQSRADGPIQQLLDDVADVMRPEWQRSALMHGVEVTVLGEVMPGSPGGRGGGGRAGRAAGDGGGGGGQAEPLSWGRGAAAASAFPEGFLAQKSRRADNLLIESFASGRSPGMISLELKREPALVRVAAGDGDMAMRATWVLGRLFWPGKPGITAEAPPLTADEQRQFTAGRLVYEGVCLGCHQADGRGRDGVAPPMVGSSVVLGPADIAARVIIHGKSGTMGLMPPMGALLNDEKVAAVLTYMRRNWGQTGSAVEDALVRSVRTATADRKTPWTAVELERLQPVGR
jgi:mono/diheme cytochrome c family protein